MKFLVFITFAILLTICQVTVGNPQPQVRGPLIWQEEFDALDYSKWMHLITGWRGGNNEFQYYHNYTQNRYILSFCLETNQTVVIVLCLPFISYVRNGILYIKPTLTADRYGEDFLYNGVLDLNQDGCNVNIDGGCYV